MFILPTAYIVVPQSPIGHRVLAFSQDFSKQSDLSPHEWKWNSGRNYNHEQERRTPREGHNAFIEDSNLVIEARKEDGAVTSAFIETYKAWRHPYVEVIAKVPDNGKGTWPAIWMLNEKIRNSGKDNVPWPLCGEIDIMENVSFDPQNFVFTLHCGKFSSMNGKQRTKVVPVANHGDFHKFGMAIDPGRITFYMDDQMVYEATEEEKSFEAWPFDDSFYLILNLAIGGDWGGAKGVDESIFPSRFVIKSVKVYE